MKRFRFILTLSIIFCSCKKNIESKPTSNSALLVKTITSKYHKIDSSGQYYTVVDSFQYDDQNRVTKYVNIQYDTSYSYDPNLNQTTITPHALTNLLTLNYTGNIATPSNYVQNGQTVFIAVNALGQLIKDSVSPAFISTFFYSPSMVVHQSGFTNSNYTIDSISVDENSNVTSFIFGGNYHLDSLNNPTYGRIDLLKYTYGTIPNPIFANKSASVIMFLYNNNFPSKNIMESSEYITYGVHSEILGDEVRHYQNIVDANNIIQKSVNVSNDEFIAWTYY